MLFMIQTNAGARMKNATVAPLVEAIVGQANT